MTEYCVPQTVTQSTSTLSKASTVLVQPNVNCPAILIIIRWIVRAARNFILCRKLTLRPYPSVPS